MKAVVLLPLLTLTLTACGPSEQNAQKAYDDQLALAKAEGLPITVEDFVALIPSVPDEQNAALEYKKITELKLFRKDTDDLSDFLKSAAHPQTLDKGKTRQFLAQFTDGLKLMDEAAAKPGCNFQRDWSFGPAVLMPEFAELKTGIKLLTLRAALNANQGNHKAAVADLLEVTAVANHIAVEPLVLPRTVANAFQVAGATMCANLAFAYPNEPIYRQTLKEVISQWPPRDPQQERANAFLELKIAIDHAEDKGFIENKIGLPKSEMTAPLAVGSTGSKLQAKAKMVEGFRNSVKAYTLTGAKADQAFDRAEMQRIQGLIVFPQMAKLFESLTMGAAGTSDRYVGVTHKLGFTAIHRALEGRNDDGTFPATLDVSDLVVPYIELPIEYSSDGKSFTVSAAVPGSDPFGGSNEVSYTFPRTAH